MERYNQPFYLQQDKLIIVQYERNKREIGL